MTVYDLSSDFIANVFNDRCYVDKSNTCQDETPSKARPGWVWSCEACTHQKKKSFESFESSESSELTESSEKNGRTGNTQTFLIDISSHETLSKVVASATET